MTAPVPGRCRYCGCTEDNACVLATGGGETCAWFDAQRTVCTAPKCMGQSLTDAERRIVELQRQDRRARRSGRWRVA